MPYDYKNWYTQNKEKHLAYCSAPVVCECNATVNRCNLAKHKRTKKHIKAMTDVKNVNTSVLILDIIKALDRVTAGTLTLTDVFKQVNETVTKVEAKPETKPEPKPETEPIPTS